MKLYRIINKTLVEEFPNWLKKDNIIYTNDFAKELAINKGWYPLSINKIPEFNSETQYIIKHYHLENNVIVLDWDIYTKSIEIDNIND